MRQRLAAISFIVAFLLFFFIMSDMLRGERAEGSQPKNIGISVILYGSDNKDRYKYLDQGIRQACRELQIEFPVISLSPAHDAQMQAEMIKKELDAGAKGLIIAAEDSGAMLETLADLQPAVPIVYVKNGALGDPYIAADDAQMANELALHIAGEARVLLISANLGRESVQKRHDAFLAACERLAIDVEQLASPELALGREELIVCLDTETLSLAVSLAREAPRMRLAGIGSSDYIVYAQGQGLLEGFIFQNEYAIGYIAAMQIAADLGYARPPAPTEIQYLYATAETMFDSQTERLLFPMIQ